MFSRVSVRGIALCPAPQHSHEYLGFVLEDAVRDVCCVHDLQHHVFGRTWDKTCVCQRGVGGRGCDITDRILVMSMNTNTILMCIHRYV